jgi:hypothetical protein
MSLFSHPLPEALAVGSFLVVVPGFRHASLSPLAGGLDLSLHPDDAHHITWKQLNYFSIPPLINNINNHPPFVKTIHGIKPHPIASNYQPGKGQWKMRGDSRRQLEDCFFRSCCGSAAAGDAG